MVPSAEAGGGTGPGDLPDAAPPAATEAVPRCPACGGGDHRPFQTTGAMMHRAGAERFSFSRCASCGLVFLNPRVPPEHLGPFYGDDYLPYRGPDAWGPFSPLVAGSFRAMDRERVRVLAGSMELGRTSRVLDVGCGKPTFLETLSRERGCVCIGVDFSDAGWRDRPDRFQGLELHRGELEGMDLSEPVDAVTMWHYLEHDYHPLETLVRCRELARPGATLVLEVPNHDSWTRRHYGPWWAGYHTPRHTCLHTPESIRVLLVRAGWEVEEVRPEGTLDPYTLDWMSRMERKRIDWSRGMGGRFPAFVVGKAAFSLRWGLRRDTPLGVLTAVARRPADS